jgi:hypothetical protein
MSQGRHTNDSTHMKNVEKRFEFHAQHRGLIRKVAGRPPPRLVQPQREPRLERPRERGHHHVGPVTQQCVDRHTCRAHALELIDQILLVAPHHDHAVRLDAGTRLIRKLRDVFRRQP